jgi:hypothetical protein
MIRVCVTSSAGNASTSAIIVALRKVTMRGKMFSDNVFGVQVRTYEKST